MYVFPYSWAQAVTNLKNDWGLMFKKLKKRTGQYMFIKRTIYFTQANYVT